MKSLPSHKEIMDKMNGKKSDTTPAEKMLELFRGPQGPKGEQGEQGPKGNSPALWEIVDACEPIVKELFEEYQSKCDIKISNFDSLIKTFQNKKDVEFIFSNLILEYDSKLKIATNKELKSIKDDFKKDLSAVLSDVLSKNISKTDLKESLKSFVSVDKFEKLKESSAKKIEKLETEISKLKEKKAKTVSGGKPGGMGDWLHEVFTLTDATTSVSLGNKIAAGGTAHMVRYQGQMLAMNIQYSINPDYQTISLLFTPENDTYLDVTYVRT